MIRGLILAGGLRRPLLPLMIHTPLPLLPVGNYPLILFQLRQLKRAGITEILLSLAHQPRAIRDLLGDGHDFGVTIRYMVESKPVGTAGAVRRAADLIDETLVVVNGDVITGASILKLLEEHRQRNSLLTVTTREVPNPGSFGVVERNRAGRVLGFHEQPRGTSPRSNEINAGIYAVEREALSFLKDSDEAQSLERDLIPRLIEEGAPIRSRPTLAYWSELTRPNRYLKTNLDVLAGRLAKPRFAAFDPPLLQRSGISDSAVDASCVLKEGVRIDDSVIGPKCRIESGARIRGSVLWPGCRVQSNARITGSILGRGVVVGEGARLRRGTILGDKSSVTGFSRV